MRSLSSSWNSSRLKEENCSQICWGFQRPLSLLRCCQSELQWATFYAEEPALLTASQQKETCLHSHPYANFIPTRFPETSDLFWCSLNSLWWVKDRQPRNRELLPRGLFVYFPLSFFPTNSNLILPYFISIKRKRENDTSILRDIKIITKTHHQESQHF